MPNFRFNTWIRYSTDADADPAEDILVRDVIDVMAADEAHAVARLPGVARRTLETELNQPIVRLEITGMEEVTS